MCPPCGWVSRGPVTWRNGRGNGSGNGNARWAAHIRARRPPGFLTGLPDPCQAYLIQASTLPRLASTHFLAAASGVILSTAMYLATVFWSSLVQLNFFTRS